MPIPLRGDLDFFNLYLDEGEIKVNGTDSIKHLAITNSKINDEDKKLSQTLDRLQLKIKLLSEEYKRAPVTQQKDSAYIRFSDEKTNKSL